MAKTFNSLLTEINSKASPFARSPADNTFLGIHAAQKHPDVAGNKDDIYNATNVKKDDTRPPDALGRKNWAKMKKDLKIAGGAEDADGDHDGDVLPGKKLSDEDLEESADELDRIRRQYHEHQADTLSRASYKEREAGNHQLADKLYKTAKEYYEKADRCDYIKEENETIEQLHSLTEGLFTSETAPFQKGQHVHMSHKREHDQEARITKHGVVAEHTPSMAHVQWEDGTESKHHQISGQKIGALAAGENGSYRVKHNYIRDEHGNIKVASNQEHKEHLARAAGEVEGRRKHERKHRELVDRIASTHPSHLKPHHIEAMHNVLDRASRGED